MRAFFKMTRWFGRGEVRIPILATFAAPPAKHTHTHMFSKSVFLNHGDASLSREILSFKMFDIYLYLSISFVKKKQNTLSITPNLFHKDKWDRTYFTRTSIINGWEPLLEIILGLLSQWGEVGVPPAGCLLENDRFNKWLQLNAPGRTVDDGGRESKQREGLRR